MLRKFNVAYFALSCDPMDGERGNRKFAESLGLDYPVLSDADRSVSRAYGVLTPDRQNPARWTFYIAQDGKILFIDKNVKTASHGEDVAAKLKELGVPAK